MKKLILLFSILGFISCNQNELSNSEIEQEIINVTKEYNQAWETVDMEIVAQFHTDDVRYYWHGFQA